MTDDDIAPYLKRLISDEDSETWWCLISVNGEKPKQWQKQGVTNRAVSEEEFTYRMSMFRRIVKSQCSLFSTVKQKKKRAISKLITVDIMNAIANFNCKNNKTAIAQINGKVDPLRTKQKHLEDHFSKQISLVILFEGKITSSFRPRIDCIKIKKK